MLRGLDQGIASRQPSGCPSREAGAIYLTTSRGALNQPRIRGCNIMIELLAIAVIVAAMFLLPMMGMIWILERFDP